MPHFNEENNKIILKNLEKNLSKWRERYRIGKSQYRQTQFHQFINMTQSHSLKGFEFKKLTQKFIQKNKKVRIERKS